MLLLELDQEQRPVALRIEFAAYIGVDFLPQGRRRAATLLLLELVDHVAQAQDDLVAPNERRTLRHDLGVARLYLPGQLPVGAPQRDDLLQAQTPQVTPAIETHHQQPQTIESEGQQQHVARIGPAGSVPGRENDERETGGFRPAAEHVAHGDLEGVAPLRQTGVIGRSRPVGLRPCALHARQAVAETQAGNRAPTRSVTESHRVALVRNLDRSREIVPRLIAPAPRRTQRFE